MHRKVLDKGKPDDVMLGIKNKKVGKCIYCSITFHACVVDML